MLPILIGLVLFCLPAVGESIVYMFSTVKIELGYVDIKFTGIENFRQAFLVDTRFRELL
ncbi:hypothetical protein FACS1894141_6290 [Spirochaetia bacterium]|nr:hypothetical protein FACS1894141_6290 [Spirochaetia bacterium]